MHVDMEFCLGCGNDLPQSKKDVRNISSASLTSRAIREGILTAWCSLMKEVLESKGLSLCDAFPDLHNSAKMCKNCF